MIWSDDSHCCLHRWESALDPQSYARCRSELLMCAYRSIRCQVQAERRHAARGRIKAEEAPQISYILFYLFSRSAGEKLHAADRKGCRSQSTRDVVRLKRVEARSACWERTWAEYQSRRTSGRTFSRTEGVCLRSDFGFKPPSCWLRCMWSVKYSAGGRASVSETAGRRCFCLSA